MVGEELYIRQEVSSFRLSLVLIFPPIDSLTDPPKLKRTSQLAALTHKLRVRSSVRVKQKMKMRTSH